MGQVVIKEGDDVCKEVGKMNFGKVDNGYKKLVVG